MTFLRPKAGAPNSIVANQRPGAGFARGGDTQNRKKMEPHLAFLRVQSSGTTTTTSIGSVAETAAAEADSTAKRHQAYVEARSAELMDLGMTEDINSLGTILSELGNRDPSIRKAAIEAAGQFGNRDAVPSLKEAALQSDDPEEKLAIRDAIESLTTPSLFDIGTR
jgi:hypothetical protein